MSEELVINNLKEDADYYINGGNKNIDVFLMKIKIEENNNTNEETYMMTVCKRKELGKEKITIIRKINGEHLFELNLKEKRDIKEIKSKNIYATFFFIFTSEINTYYFENSENLGKYENLIDKFKKYKKGNIICNFIKNCFSKKYFYIGYIIIAVFLIVGLVIGIILFLNRDKIIKEKDDDSILEDDVIYIRDMSHKYKDENYIKIFYNNGNIKYDGPFKNYKAEGKGKYYSKEYNNILYDGNFEKGKPNGNGSRYYFEGNNKIGYYNGSWIKGKRSGIGEMYYKDGSTYKGLWENDKRNGEGKLNYTNGDYYEGEFKDDKYYGKGKGKMHYDKSVYEGDFINGLKEGKGKLNFTNGDYYEGDFANDLREGKGKLNFTNGDYYEGGFKNDLMEGQGTYRYKNSEYIGEWKEDKKHGKGIIHYYNGDCYEGYFLNNIRDGSGIYCYNSNKKCFKGYWTQNVKHGEFSPLEGKNCF